MRTLRPELKAKIILLGLLGKPLYPLCVEYGIELDEYFRLEETFLRNMQKPMPKNMALAKQKYFKKHR